MDILYVLITISLILASLFLYLFIKSVKNNQYEDTYSPPHRILFDDKEDKK